MIAAFVIVAAAVASAAEWENPDVNSIDRLPARTYSMPLACETDALTDAPEPETPYRKSLNGDWKINWVGQPSLRPVGFEKPDYDDSAWDTIDVPSCVEMRGFGVPHYTNIKYPHANRQPLIRDRVATNLVFNPVSSYRTRFTVPADWKGRRVILRFDGVYSAFYVWVNGRRVGYSEDSTLAAEFDVTDAIGDGENLLAVEVYKWCDGSYLEDQDMFRFSGIFRDVTLWSMPKDGIWDFAVGTIPIDSYEKWKLEVKVEGEGEQRTEASFYDADGEKVVDLHSSPSSSTFTSTLSARAWSAEKPYLYTLVLRRGDDIRMKRVGFKEVKVVGNTVLFNGRKIKFKGVNRHETDPENGKTVSLADMRRDVELMKKYNFNTVRTAHYPDHHLWYDLCDRYGLYVIAEANVEAHEPGYAENGLGAKPMWRKSIVERNVNHAVVFRNHPCVTFWSPGNETGHGDAFLKAFAEIRKLDGTRPFVWERGNVDVEIDSAMYYPVDWVRERGRLGEAKEGSMEDRYQRPSGRQSAGKPFFHLEYAHAMGNALGNFKEYWDAYYDFDCLIGGCVWDWIDQTLWKTLDRTGPNGKPVRILAYGGDYDEAPNLGPFCVNGLIGSDRKVTPKLTEAGHVLRNLIVDDDLTLENRYGFTNANEFKGEWELVEDGVVVKRGTFDVPDVPPLSKGRLARPDVTLKDGHEYFMNVSFVDGDGWVVSRNQVCLKERGSGLQTASRSGKDSASPFVEESDAFVSVAFRSTMAVFSRRTGTLAKLEMDGRAILEDCGESVHGPRLTCIRAFVDNDFWLRGDEENYLGWPTKLTAYGFYNSGLSQLRYHAPTVKVLDGGRTIETCVTVNGSKSAGFRHRAVWTFLADGSIEVENETEPFGEMPEQLPRFGLSCRLDGALTNMTWYGRGPEENYIDRCTGTFMGRYSSTVAEQYVPYARPQDCGYKSDVRWVSFADDGGRGVRFSFAEQQMFVQALHYTWEGLEFARHRAGQLRINCPPLARKEICLNLDLRQCGLGNGSCGNNPTLPRYRFAVKPERWTMKISPARSDL